MSGRGNRGGASAPRGARPASLGSTSSAAADAALAEEELLRDVQKEIEEKTGARHCAQEASSSSSSSSSAPPSPSKVLGVGENSAPSLPWSAARTLREQNTVSDVAGTPESAAIFDVAVTADAQGKAAFAEMEQAMAGLTDISHKKVETPKSPRDFAAKCRSNDADALHGGVMDDPVILASGYIQSLKDNYLSKLMELDQQYTVPNLTEDEKTEEFNNKVRTKRYIGKALKFLQVDKSHLQEGLTKKFPKYEALILSLMPLLKENSDPVPVDKRPQQEQAQPADESPSFPINSTEGQVQPEGAETLVAKNPFDRLRHAVRCSSPAALRSSVHSMLSVLRERDKHVFEHSSPTQSSLDDCGVPLEGDASKSESSGLERQKMKDASYTLLEEIKSINRTLIDTEITIAGDSGIGRITPSCDAGTAIKLSYTAVALSPDLRSLFASSEMCVVMPVKLSVPPDYPRRSPMLIIDKEEDQLRKKSSHITKSVDAAFALTLRDLPEPRSIKDIARAWDTCVRTAVTEFAHQYGRGTFSSRFGRWESFVG